MRRSLPRLFATALVVLVGLGSASASAQELVASNVMNTATVLPSSMTSTVLFPATPATTAAAQAATPLTAIGQSGRFDGPRRPAALPALYASTALLQALDAHSTMKAIGAGAHEANPMMKGVAGNKGALLAVKAGVAGATIFMAEKMWRRNPVGAVAMMAVVNSVNAFVVAHNYRVVKGLQ
jgi:Domain of unknown function (DUF5658)